jgi:hypothetical protein
MNRRKVMKNNSFLLPELIAEAGARKRIGFVGNGRILRTILINCFLTPCDERGKARFLWVTEAEGDGGTLTAIR